MLRRRIASLCLLLPLSVTLSMAGCEKPPATDTTPPDATAQTEPAPEPEPAPLPTADEVLARSIEAVGGAEAIGNIASSYTEARSEMKAQGITVLTRIWSKGKDFYVESDMTGVGLSQVWKKGDEIWSKDPINGMRKLEGDEAAQSRWSSDPMLAANWKEYFDEAKVLGRTEDGDRSLVEVELSNAAGVKLVLLFDEATGLPAGQTFEQQTPMGAMPIRVMVDDYREVSGVKFAFRSVTDMQVMTVEQNTETLEVNVEIDDAKFEVPHKAPADPAPEAAPEPKDGGKKGKGKKGKAAKAG